MADVAVIRDFFVALGFKTNESDAKKMQGSLVDTEAKAKLLNKALVGLAAAALVAVAKTAKELDKLYYSSQRIGASASNVQAYGDAISQLGGNAEAAVASLESVSQKIRNSPGYEKMVQGLGVATRDQNGAVRDRVEVLKDLSGTLAKMPHYQANAYASSLGIDEQTMMSMRDGKFIAGIEKYQKMRKEMGMTDELAKSGTDFMVESRELGMAVKGVSEVLLMTAGKALIPFLKLINKGIQTAIHLFSELHPAIKGTLAAGLKFAFLALVLKGFLNSLMMLRAGLTLLMSFLPVLKALRLAFLMSPIGIIIALAAAFALLWEDYKTWKEGGKSGFNWSGWADGINNIISKIKDFIEMINKIKDKVINFIKKVVDDPVGAIQEFTEAAQEALTSVVESEPVQNAIQAGQGFVDSALNYINGVQLPSPVSVAQAEPLPDYPVYSKQATPKTSSGLAAFAQNQPTPTSVVPKSSANQAQAIQQPKLQSKDPVIAQYINQGFGFAASVANMINQGVKSAVPAQSNASERIVKLVKVEGLNRTYLMADGTTETRGDGTTKNSGTVAWRNNNPGNLKFGFKGSADKTDKSKRSKEKALSDAKKRYAGVIDLDQWGNAIFETAEAGAVAKAKLLKSQHSDKTVSQMLRKYAVDDYSGKTNYKGYENTIYKQGDQKGVNLRLKTIGQMTDSEFEALAQGMVIAEGVKKGVVTKSKNLTSSNYNLRPTEINSFAPPTGNPEKSQINSSSSMSASNITIHQSFQTDMTINGARDPSESANAVKRQQDNSLAFMARNAMNPLVG